MDSQRPLLYLSLVFMLFLTWLTWQQDQTAKLAPAPVATTVAPAVPAAEVPSPVADTPAAASPPAGAAADAASQQVTVRTDTLHLRINARGGDIVAADLPTYPVSVDKPEQAVRILDAQRRNYVAQSGLQHTVVAGQDVLSLAPDHQALFRAEQEAYELAAGQDKLVVPLVWEGPNGIRVTKRYTFQRGSFLVQVEHEVHNGSAQPWSGTAYQQLKHGPVAEGASLFGIYAYTGAAYYKDGAYTKLPLSNMEEEKLDLPVKGGWVAMQEHYFLSAWIPPAEQQGQYYSLVGQSAGAAKSYIIGVRSPVLQVAPGTSGTFNSQFYVGPKDQDRLAKIAPALDLTVDYGMFAFISKPIFWLMQLIHNVVGNWGWTIILLTVLIKAIFFYPSALSYKSMAKLKALAPKLQDINTRFANDPQGKQKAMLDLYRKEKINPLGGCLPILIQIPVFMGLYFVLLESVELRQAPWILWYKDLSVMDPYFVLPLIMGATMYLQYKLNPPPSDPMQAKVFQFMPIIFTVLFLWFPAGLVLYWVVNNLLSIAQQWYINKKIVGHA